MQLHHLGINLDALITTDHFPAYLDQQAKKYLISVIFIFTNDNFYKNSKKKKRNLKLNWKYKKFILYKNLF